MRKRADTPSLADLGISDGPRVDGFDRLTRLATSLFNTPVALVSIVEFDRDRQFFASEQGLSEPWASKRETPLTHSFCQHVKTSGAPLVVPDARQDPLVQDNLAIRDFDVIAYLGVPIYGADDAPVGALCVIDGKPRAWSDKDVNRLTDLADAVTDQIKLRAALVTKDHAGRQAERLGRIVRQAHHEVFTFDSETFKFIEVNAGACENLGYSFDELQSLTPRDIKSERSPGSFDELIERFRSGSQAGIQLEAEHQRKDGTTYPVAIRLELHKDEDQEMFVAFCEDITERRALEEEIRLKNVDFETLFLNSPDAISISELDTTRTLANPGLARIAGKPVEKLIGEKFSIGMEPEQRDLVMKGIATRTPESPYTSYVHQLEVDGALRSILWTTIVLFEGEDPQRIFSVGRDVTDLQTAKMLAETKAQEAETANRAKSAFLTNMSHEIRTPLNGVIGMASALGKTELSEDQEDMVSVISSAGSHLLDLLTDILELAKIEAEEESIQYEAIDPVALVRGAVALFDAKAAEKYLILSCETPDVADGSLSANAKRIRQVLNNLMSNAIKFTDDGSIMVHAELLESEEPGTSILRVQVKDTGRGVPDAQKGQIFGRFDQGDHTEDLHLGGIGLGLAISKAICRTHGGDLHVEDTPGGGATFVASFTLRNDTARETVAEKQSLGVAIPPSGSSLRVLVAEDNEMNQRVLKALFRDEPVELVIVSNGEEALQKLSEEVFDSALIDVRMPVMGGLECVRRYRAIEKEGQRLPIVSCSANVMSDQIESYDEAGFDWHLPKPIDDAGVARFLSWLDQHRAAG